MKKAIIFGLLTVITSFTSIPQAATVNVHGVQFTISEFKPDVLDPPTDTPTTKTSSVQINDVYAVPGTADDLYAYDFHVTFELLPFKGRALVNGDENDPFQNPQTIKRGNSYKISWESPNPVLKGTSIEMLFSVQIPINEIAKISVTDAYWTDENHNRIQTVPIISSIWLLLTGLASIVAVSSIRRHDSKIM